jgi:hypothetical protein
VGHLVFRYCFNHIKPSPVPHSSIDIYAHLITRYPLMIGVEV